MLELGKKPAGVQDTDPEYVGAWWIGYVICGLCGLLFVGPLALFPRQFPRGEDEDMTAAEKDALEAAVHVSSAGACL